MKKPWKDPDTGLVHVIDHEEDRLSAWEHAKRFFRCVHTGCGIAVQLDSDEFIIPRGEAMRQSPPPILRPWLTGREAPTCVVCATAKSSEPMRSVWGSKLRGA